MVYKLQSHRIWMDIFHFHARMCHLSLTNTVIVNCLLFVKIFWFLIAHIAWLNYVHLFVNHSMTHSFKIWCTDLALLHVFVAQHFLPDAEILRLHKNKSQLAAQRTHSFKIWCTDLALLHVSDAQHFLLDAYILRLCIKTKVSWQRNTVTLADMASVSPRRVSLAKHYISDLGRRDSSTCRPHTVLLSAQLRWGHSRGVRYHTLVTELQCNVQ